MKKMKKNRGKIKLKKSNRGNCMQWRHEDIDKA